MPVTRPWYPLRDAAGVLTMRRYNRAIEVRWGHWTGTAIYQGPPVAATAGWVEPRKKGPAEPLPPRKVVSYRDSPNGQLIDAPASWLDRNGWGREPSAWRPLPGSGWPDPLPAPLSITPSAEGIKARIDHVAYDLAANAAELEDERQRRRNSKDEDPDEQQARMWWRDGSRIAYSPRGKVTADECEGRVLRGLYWLGHGTLRGRGIGNSPLASMVVPELSADEIDDRSGRLPQLVRMPAESDDRILEAMGWVAELLLAKPRYARRWVQLLITLASDKPMTLARAGERCGLAGCSGVSDVRKRALRHLLAIANKGTPLVDARMRETRQRTRDARQAASAAA